MRVKRTSAVDGYLKTIKFVEHPVSMPGCGGSRTVIRRKHALIIATSASTEIGKEQRLQPSNDNGWNESTNKQQLVVIE